MWTYHTRSPRGPTQVEMLRISITAEPTPKCIVHKKEVHIPYFIRISYGFNSLGSQQNYLTLQP